MIEFGIVILVIGQPMNIQSLIVVVPLATVPTVTVNVCSVYRLILGTMSVSSMMMVISLITLITMI